MTRPYRSHAVETLETLFDEQRDDTRVLEQLVEELANRQTKRARRLLSLVAERLATFHPDGKEDEDDSELAAFSSTDEEGHGVAQANSDESEEIVESHAPGDTADMQDDRYDDLDRNTGSSRQKQSISPLCAEAARMPSLFGAETQDFEQSPDDRRRPQHLSRMRPPGTTGLPDPWVRPRAQNVSLGVSKDADLPDFYIGALTALIAEIKKTGVGQKRYELENGTRVEASSGDTVYVFPFTDEADLFEDARVEVAVPGRRIEGSVVSIAPGRLVLAVKEDLGPILSKVVILIDATALLEALKEKIDQIRKGGLTINRALADAVVGRAAPPAAPTPIPAIPPSKLLNDAKLEAYNKALTAAITYIWGPPGCGKTWTLGEIVRAAFEGEKRVLICSNTNKAVDQVLLQICETLTLGHPAMEQGKIVRIGRIADDELATKYKDYVTVEGIAERLSKELAARRTAIEDEISRIDERTAQAHRALEHFARLDVAEQTVEILEKETGTVAAAGRQHKSNLDGAQMREEELARELRERKNAFFVIFKRNEETIRRDISSTRARREKLLVDIEATKKRHSEARLKCEAAQKQRDQLRSLLEQQDRSAIERQIAKADEVRAPLVSELRDIEAKIAQLRLEILKSASVLGATATKTYMAVKEIGQFDMVIIDEASMVTLPMVWFAAGLARERVVVCGDFCQIPPIVQTGEQAVYEALGLDVFEATKLADLRVVDERRVMLDTQFRMDPAICGLISGPMYDGRLKTASNRESKAQRRPPPPFEGALTIIDTADLWPFESVNAFYSRFNLMHALLVRNLAWHFKEKTYIKESGDLGICTPYAAQSKLIRKLLDSEGLENLVQVGTVHSFQGNERNAIVLDIPEGHGGGRMLGQFVQGVPPGHVGARLINVAVSRAENHLIVLANLTHLDRLLPSSALLREILYEMQQRGRVVSGSKLLALRPVEHDLRGLIGRVKLDLEAETLGLFNQATFDPAIMADIASARESIVIFSGFVTPKRVAMLGDLLRSKIAEGVRVRCITRPPHRNGTMDFALGKEALDMLEGIGCVVDCRARIHEKVILIDKETVWHGSLNALSHTHRTDESMTRLLNAGLAQAVAANISKRYTSGQKALSSVAEAENPRCDDCGARSVYEEGRNGPFFYCENQCGWSVSLRTMRGSSQQRRGTTNQQGLQTSGLPCPLCKGKTTLRNGPYGAFYGCVNYPACKGIAKQAKSGTGKRAKGRKARVSRERR